MKKLTLAEITSKRWEKGVWYMRFFFILFCCLWMAVSSAGQVESPILKSTIAIGENGGWDCLTVDTSSQRLYVSHSTRVNVIDLEKGQVVAEIPNTPRVHAIAVAPEYQRGFISNGGDSSVTVFDLKTDSTIANVKVPGANPDAILYDPFSRSVFVFNGRSDNVSVIGAQSLKILSTIPLDGKPEFAVSDLNGRIFVNIEDKSAVDVLDAKALKLTGRWPLAPCEEPSGLAIDRKNRRLFAAGSNALMVVLEADSGHIIASLPIGKGVDGAAFDPTTRLLFSPNGEGTLTVIREETPERYSVAATIPTVKGARTIALDERTHRIYLPVGSRPDSTGAAKQDFRVLVFQQ